MRWISRCFEIAIAAAGAWSTACATVQEPIRIAGRWELLIDHYLIEQMQGDVELRLHEPVPQEVLDGARQAVGRQLLWIPYHFSRWADLPHVLSGLEP